MAEKHCSSCQPIPVRAVKSLVHPPGCHGQPLKRLEGLQLQICTLIERLYQLGTGEEESFRHAREGVPSPGGIESEGLLRGGLRETTPRGGEANEQGGCPTGSNEAIFRPGK